MFQRDIFISLFDLTPTEDVVFEHLRTEGRASVADITRAGKHPRSTVVDALARLRIRGLVRPVQMGRRTHWKATDTMKLAEKFLNISELLMTPHVNTNEERQLRLKVSRETEFVVYVGWRNMVHVYEREIASHPRERLLAVQSAQSARTALAKGGDNSFEPMNRAIKEHKLIVEAIISRGMFTLYQERGRAWLQSMEGRMNAVRVVPDSILNFSADLLLFRNIALFANWEEEVLVLIKNADMLAMIKRLYTLLYDTGETVDQNEYIRKLLAGSTD